MSFLISAPRGLAAALVGGALLASDALPFATPTAAQRAPARPAARPLDLAQPRLIVRLLPGTAPDDLAAALGGEVLRSRPEHGIHLLSVPGATESSLDALVWALKGLPTVLYAESDQPADPPETGACGPPEETVGAQQCTIAFIDGAPAPGTYSEQYALELIRGDAAHLLATGVPLVVAVIDTGVEVTHELFLGHVAPGGWDYVLDIPGGVDVANLIDDDGDGAVDEGAGHGSHVAGLVVLADPNVLVLPMRVLDSDGNGSAFLVAAAIYDSVDQGATVVNLSLSTRTNCAVIAEALMYAEYHGVEVVASAGNSGLEPEFPGNYKPEDYAYLTPPWLPPGTQLTNANLLTVSAVDALDLKPSFACYGAEVDLATPGVDVYSAQLGGAYAWWSGTSMSAGLASGSVSWVLSIWGQGAYAGTPQDLLRATADDLDVLNPAYAGGLGHGRLNLLSAANLLLGL